MPALKINTVEIRGGVHLFKNILLQTEGQICTWICINWRSIWNENFILMQLFHTITYITLCDSSLVSHILTLHIDLYVIPRLSPIFTSWSYIYITTFLACLRYLHPDVTWQMYNYLLMLTQDLTSSCSHRTLTQNSSPCQSSSSSFNTKL